MILTRSLGHGWRLLVTGACFALFGLGGLTMSLVAVPILWLMPGGRWVRQRRARWLISRSFAALISTLRACGVMYLTQTNAHHLTQAGGTLIVANHPTYLDVVLLLARVPNANCIVKSALWRNPFYAAVVQTAGYLRNDDPDQLLESCAASLARGAPLLVFSEGTRTTPGCAPRFLRGTAHIALRSGVSILPVVIRCDPPTLGKGQPWYKIPARRFRMSLDARAPSALSHWTSGEARKGLAARHLTERLESYFSQALDDEQRTVT